MFEDEENPRFEFKNAPIYKKAYKLMKLVDKIIEAVDTTDMDFVDEVARKDWIHQNLHFMKVNAQLIPTKIAGSYGVGIYDLKMENAALIRKAARELITDARGIQMNGYKETEYLDLLRAEVEEFRILFAKWVKTFDINDYIIDRWGLFNPPGVNYDDHDPDDDIPFDTENFFNEMEELEASEEWKKDILDDDDLDETEDEDEK